MLSFGVLLVVLLAVLFSAKKQAQALKPPAPPASSTAPAVPLPQAVGAQVQGTIDQAAQRASELQP